MRPVIGALESRTRENVVSAGLRHARTAGRKVTPNRRREGRRNTARREIKVRFPSASGEPQPGVHIVVGAAQMRARARARWRDGARKCAGSAHMAHRKLYYAVCRYAFPPPQNAIVPGATERAEHAGIKRARAHEP